MAKGAYIGVNNVARKIKKSYIGVDGIARKIKKAYIGIGGVARPCFSSSGIEYFGTITPLSVARGGMAATSTSDYALFAGGSSTGSNIVDVYDKSLKHYVADNLSNTVHWLAATTLGNFALFGGGCMDHSKSGTYIVSATVDVYNQSLEHLTTSEPLSVGRYNLSATSVGNYALFAGGEETKRAEVSTVDVYNQSLIHSTTTEPLSVARGSMGVASIGNCALFVGGQYNSITKSTVDVYNQSLQHSILADLPNKCIEICATSIENYAIFDTRVYNNYIFTVYDKSLSQFTIDIGASSGLATYGKAATSIGNYALFGGGDGLSKSNIVFMIDKSLTISSLAPLSEPRYDVSATSVGNYALFAGGYSAAKDTVDAYVYIPE
jgi:hypothetical protein